ncbi:TonB-dependent receptor [Pseudoduganella namucuonensis]|uniref:Iron complex outermembrane recepter protein n=1 Tax=Pseudoduganella namucuonensis TaxID=1035707 RepID=A0A1I7J743_9BURK|nr:TonB-dependent receptor [Pseudoduganella namucuonensis]SFU80983.1 iron complex outermembrane recepter protein [Pseudoduganella namucuonensis]
MHNLKCKPLAAMLAAMGVAASMISPAWADHVVTINGGRPTSLPTQIPTTMEGITGAQVEDRINASDSEDALKYLPSLNVRKRYIGDYDHAVLASRASGTGNSARSMVYADGILLSNLLGNGATYTPRWGLVTPEEIERVDVLYGPFSAAYPGNSVGAVVDFQTRMPARFEAHVKLSGYGQGFRLYGTDSRHYGKQGSASVGDRDGAWSWWLDVSRLDSNGQPVAFANKLVSQGVAGGGGVPVTGAIADRNPSNRDWLILGATNQVHTVQDHAKAKLAYDFSPVLRASYTLGWWRNDAVRTSTSYLRDAAGKPVHGGDINVAGRRYTLLPSDFAPSRGDLEHLMHGLSLKQNGKGVFDWEIAASLYDYARDLVRTPTVAVPDPYTKAQGNVNDMGGSGWNTLALKGIWRPQGMAGAHIVDFGVQRDSAKLRTHVFRGEDWIGSAQGAHVSTFNGATRLESVYAQDSWRFGEAWKATLGLRHERWRAFDGVISNAAGKPLPFAARSEDGWSPKAALAYRATDSWTLKASTGRALRNPTAAELFQGSIVDGRIVNNDPTLRAERSQTSELTAEQTLERGGLRVTAFHEHTRDALYSQALTPTVNTIQNVGKIRTGGLELSYQADEVLVHGLALTGSVTYADSKIVANPAVPASEGKRQPRVPDWRATLLASYHVGDRWTSSLGLRYSGRQYGTLDNSDPNGATYMGVADYLVADARVRYRFDRHWTGALGIDNLNNRKYWAFHPYTQRTLIAELKFDM